MIEFFKYQGTGNDFILIDNRNQLIQGSKEVFAKKWCDRRFGIGSDGLILIEKSERADFLMNFFNPDGSQSFCGNGSRCAVRFVRDQNIILSDQTSFEAIDGIHQAIISGDTVSIEMKNVNEIQLKGDDYFIHTGSPHYISYDENDEKDIIAFGKKIRYAEAYKPGGTNVNLVKTISGNHIGVKTYERGVEDETFSCGTGVTACALSFAHKNNIQSGTITVDVKGGRLQVNFEKNENGYQNIQLQGPAQFVYKGIIDDAY